MLIVFELCVTRAKERNVFKSSQFYLFILYFTRSHVTFRVRVNGNMFLLCATRSKSSNKENVAAHVQCFY